jgi:catechol 2,3-dioxygenase-like lactoylglutathione lyase family enzyme
MLGEFLEISLSTGDILASLEFYRKLGFVEAPVQEAWRHPYTVITDGRLYIGLHARETLPPALSFALPELRSHLPTLETLGIEFSYCNIELHRFNEVGFLDPDGGLVALLEARTYSPVHVSQVQATLCGYFLEYRLPVRDPTATLAFWERLGLIATPAEDDQPAQVSWGGINITLETHDPRVKPALVFVCPDLQETEALLEMRGLPIQNDSKGLRVTTPEGLNLLLTAETG